MVFMCQRDSFLKQYETQVVSCGLVEDKCELSGAGVDVPVGVDATTISNNVFRVVLDDTIIFPEGGGQPDDRGTINDAEVIRSIRKSTEAIHYVVVNAPRSEGANGEVSLSPPFKNGEKVSVKIDWKRRFDHMQQHSGQHLITAIADTMFGFKTTSWWLGSEESYIEMDTKDITPTQLSAIEVEANAKIREGVPVSVDVVELDDPKLKNARGRNLPEDVKGQIRIVTMDGIESNVCCGTHVTSLTQLQVIKLLHVIKKKGKCLLHFLSGDRVIQRFTQQFQREQLLMNILKSSPSEFPSAAEKLNISLKNARKSCQVLSKDLAALEAKKFFENKSTPKFWHYHRDNVDLDFANSVLRELAAAKTTVLLITIKTEGTSGHMMLVGGELNNEMLVELGSALCEVLDGKGTQRGNLYQAKVNKVTNVKKAVKIAEEFIQKIQTKNGDQN